MALPCTKETREYKSWEECPEGSGLPARRTTLCNVDELACAIAEKLAEVGGTMICDIKVVNVVAGVPLTVTSNEIDNICDFEILDANGNKIELGTKKTGASTIEICSNVSLNNIQVYFTGEK